ncbi:pentapeptide repeat-containing protein [Oceanicaulis alexandrii]|uniref:pentapeptide repeat-containing protein n=1 Tax=Oceanicaulis alexandrii TaxID=153233 RepID=UPI003B506AB4
MPLDLSVIAAHEAFIAGRAGGCRAYFRFQDLTGTSLMKRKLDGNEFIGCDLSESNFALTSLVTASFYCSSLKRADLRGADLSRADLRGAILRGADLYRANLDGADFRKAVLYKDERDAEFKHNDWVMDTEGDGRDGAVDFRDCTLRGARLSSAKLKGADFSGAMLDGAKLNQADLRDANFEGAVLTGADLNGTRLDGANLENVVRDPADEALARAEELQQRLEQSDLYTRSRGEQGQRGNFEGEDLRVLGQAFRQKGLIGANLRGVCGVGLDFSGASLIGAVFSGSDLRGANFTGANLKGVNFKDCKLNHAIFKSADLRAFTGNTGRAFLPCFDGASTHAARFEGAMMDREALGLTPAEDTVSTSSSKPEDAALAGEVKAS